MKMVDFFDTEKKGSFLLEISFNKVEVYKIFGDIDNLNILHSMK